jgi:type IV secretory pathway TrbF-like protein
VLSVGSVGSAGSLFSVGSFLSLGCLMSGLSIWSVMSWRAKQSVLHPA